MKNEKKITFNDIVKKHNIKVVMCGDDKTIPKIIHARIKSTCDEIITIERSEFNCNEKTIKAFDVSMGWTWSEEEINPKKEK